MTRDESAMGAMVLCWRNAIKTKERMYRKFKIPSAIVLGLYG